MAATTIAVALITPTTVAALSWPDVADSAVMLSAAVAVALGLGARGASARRGRLRLPVGEVDGPLAMIGLAALSDIAVLVVLERASEGQLALCAYLLAAGVFASGLLTSGHRVLRSYAAAGLASLGSAALLVAAEVQRPEAFSATPALLTAAVGLWQLRSGNETSSLQALSLPLSIALGPTVVQVLADPDDWVRVVALAAVAAGLGSLGLRLGWAAPVLAAGVLTVVVVGTQGWVLAGALPRWVTFAVAGLVLVGVSASYERQLLGDGRVAFGRFDQRWHGRRQRGVGHRLGEVTRQPDDPLASGAPTRCGGGLPVEGIQRHLR